MNEIFRHLLQTGIGIWLQSAWLVCLGLAFGRAVRSRGALAASAAYRGTLVSVIVSAVLGATLAGHIRPLLSINLPSKAAATLSPPRFTHFAGFSPHVHTKTAPLVVRATSNTSAVHRAVLSSHTLRRLMPVYEIVVVLWAAVASLLLVWLLACHFWLWRLRHLSAEVSSSVATELLADVANRMGVRRPGLRVSAGIRTPFVAGAVRPVIYFPAGYVEELSSVDLRAILSHELAHVRQHDCLWNVVSRVTCALFWMQPLLWLLRRRWQEASEEVCDQWVLSFDCPPNVYAECLLRLADSHASRHSGIRPERIAGVGVFSFKSLLGRRIQSILSRTQIRLLNLSNRARTAVALGTMLAAVVAVFLISTPARSMVRKQINRLSAVSVVAAKVIHPEDPVKKRSATKMKKSHVNPLLPALLALASGAVQVNLPAAASPAKASPLPAAAAPKPAASPEPPAGGTTAAPVSTATGASRPANGSKTSTTILNPPASPQPVLDIRNYKMPVDHLTADDALKAIQAEYIDPSQPRIGAVIDKNANAIVFHCTPDQFAQLREVMRMIDDPRPSISINLRIVSATPVPVAAFGLDPAKIAGGLGKEDQAKLEAALTSGKLTVKEAPMLTTSAGIPASMSLQSGGPSATGTTVSVTPSVFSNDTISTSIHVEDTSLDGSTPKTQSFDVHQVFLSGETGLVAAIQEDNKEIKLIFATATLRRDVHQRMQDLMAADQPAH